MRIGPYTKVLTDFLMFLEKVSYAHQLYWGKLLLKVMHYNIAIKKTHKKHKCLSEVILLISMVGWIIEGKQQIHWLIKCD